MSAQDKHKEALESFKEAVSLAPTNATFKNAVVRAHTHIYHCTYICTQMSGH